jgi:hypothetical protein
MRLVAEVATLERDFIALQQHHNELVTSTNALERRIDALEGRSTQ